MKIIKEEEELVMKTYMKDEKGLVMKTYVKGRGTSDENLRKRRRRTSPLKL